MTSSFDCTPSSSVSGSSSTSHQYNTRSSSRRCEQGQDVDSVNSFVVNPRHSPESRPKKTTTANKKQNVLNKIMDYCSDRRYAGCRGKKASFNWCHFIEGIFLIGLAICFFSVMTGYSKINDDIVGLRTEMKKNNAKKNGERKTKMGPECGEALKVLSRDPTGRADFALQSSGGKIEKTVDTKNYLSSRFLFGLSLCEGPNGPSSIIQSSTAPGECWAFKGPKGKVIIRLTGSVQIDAVSLEHIPQVLSPSGTIDSAPRDFKIYGCDKASGKDEKLLGVFQYDSDSDPIQTFAITGVRNSYSYVIFEVLSNHGNGDFTCVYRLRVHGVLSKIDNTTT